MVSASAIIIILQNNLSNFAKENGMKHLKKILLAVLILALLATAVVVVALAEDGEEEVVYNGTVAEARKLLDAVEDMETNLKKSEQLKKVYSYVFKAGASSLVDPYEDGFEDLMLDYSDATLKVAQAFLKEYKDATGYAKEETLKHAYSHYANAPVYEDYESLNEDGYNEWQVFKSNYTIEAVKVLLPYLEPINEAETLEARHAALKTLSSKFKRSYIYFMLSNKDDATYEIDGLTDLVHGYNYWCVSIANECLDGVTTPEQMTVFRRDKWISPDHTYERDSEYFNVTYLPLAERIDLNIIKYANQLVDAVKVTPENYKSQAKEALGAVYSYLESTECIALDRSNLADTVGAEHEALQKRITALSYEIATYYYGEVEKLAVGDEAKYSGAVADFIEFLKSCPAIVYRPVVAPDEYAGELSAAEELLLAVRGEEKEYLNAFTALYAYLSENALDPALDSSKDFYSEYETTKREVSDFVVSYLHNLDSAPTVEGGEEIDEKAFRKELEKLGEIAAFLNTTPVSSSAIIEYNETASAFIVTMEKLWCRQIEYKAPENADAIGALEAAKALLGAVDLKAEGALDAYLALYEYLVKTPVDKAVDGADEFYEKFAELSGEVYAILSEEIDALATKPAYVEIFAHDCPELAYNAPVSETFDGTVKDATALLEAAKALVDSDAELSEIFAAYAAAYVYNYKTSVKPDLNGAEDYLEAFATLTEDVSALVVEALAEFDVTPKTTDEEGNEIVDADALKESAKALAVFASFLKECPVSAEAIDVYNGVRKALYDAISASYGSENDSERFDSDLAKLVEIASYLEKINAASELLDEYNVKASEFKASLSALNCPVVIEKPFSSKKLDGDVDEALALLDAVTVNAKERLAAYSELYKYLKANAISPDEEGSDSFYSEYALLTASIAEEVMNKISNLNPDSYYFEAEYPQIIYSAIEPLTYAGNIADATALLNKVKYALGDANPDAQEIMAAYAELYDYVRRSSVPRNVLGADKFYADLASVNAAAGKIVIAAIQAPTDFEGSLEANEEILAFIRDYRVSEEAVAAYNSTVAALKPYVPSTLLPAQEELEASLKNVIEIAEFLKASPVSVDVVTLYNEVLNAYTVSLKKVIDAEYGTFVGVKAELEAYVASSSKTLEDLGITLLPEEIDYEAFLEKIEGLDAYVKVKEITDYIYNADYDEIGNKITSVDEFREDIVKTLNDIIAADLLVYNPVPESDVYSGNVESAQSIIDRYNAESDASLKAEIYRELFNYIKKNAMNSKLNGYEGVMNSFNAIGEEVYKSFIANIDASNDKGAATAEMRAYLEEIPISEAAVNAYNMKYLSTYKDQLNASYEAYAAVTLKLHEFIESLEGADELIDSFEGLASVIDNYETLETLALVQFYEMKVFDDDPNSAVASVTARGSAFKILKKYAKKYPIGEGSYAYEETMGDVNRIFNEYNALIENAKLALDDNVPLEDYSNDAYFKVFDNDNGKAGIRFNNADVSIGNMVEVLEDTERGGYYAKYSYGLTTKRPYMNLNSLPGTMSFIIEFDLTGDDGVKKFSFDRIDRPENYGYADSYSRKQLFVIRDNKFYSVIEGVEQKTAWKDREIITPGEWTKFIFVYDPVNVTLTAYIDYEFVETWSIRNTSYPTVLPFVEMRSMASPEPNTSINLDNFKIYSGSGFRITDKFDSMSLGEEFEYFVNYMVDDTKLSTSRLEAYRKATSLLEEIKLDAALLEELKDTVDKYNAADVETDIIVPAKAANLIKIKEYGTLLATYEGQVTTQNYATVQLLVDEIEEFMASNSEYIDKTDDSYKAISASISRFKSLLDRYSNISHFVDALAKFDKAYTLAAKTKYYTSSVQYYELAQLYREDIRLEVMTDPAIVEFEALINEGITSDDEDYVDILTYYENCGKELGIQQNKENSKRIIDCLEFVESLDGYEDTEAFWEANFDYIDKYMTIIRDVVRTNAYDETYPGVEEAIARFREIDVYFYAALQEVHIAFINENLERYASSESYIEKLGICTYVNNYIEANDIDLTNSILASLVLKNETYLSELEIYRSEYVTVLEQNTIKFINTVEEMKTQVSYKALSDLYAKALVYYYEMNITEASEAAIEVFERYSQSLKKMEEDSALFFGYANELAKAKNDAEIFKALVECEPYRDLASTDIAGVSDAIASYDKALSDYNAKADLINGDIAEVNTVVSVTRTNNIAAAIMSVINKICNR